MRVDVDTVKTPPDGIDGVFEEPLMAECGGWSELPLVETCHVVTG